jgi:cytochrome c5
MACRACGQVDAVATSLKPAKDAPGKHVLHMLCRACHHRWQDAVTIETDM